MLFIGNTCFRRKIVYHNKMHLHYPSLKKRLAPSSIKSRTHVFKKVKCHSTWLRIRFADFDKSVLITKIKASILWYHLCYHIWNHIFYIFYAHYEWNEQAVIVCRLEYKNTYTLFYKQHFFLQLSFNVS